MVSGAAVGIIIGLLVGIVIGLIVGRRETARAADRAAAVQERGDAAEARARAAELEAARLGAQLEAQQRLASSREQDADAAHRRLVGEFATVSQEALRANTEHFLALAGAKLAEIRQSAGGDLAQHRQAIHSLIGPLREELDRYGAEVRDLERSRIDAYRGLTDHLQSLREGHQRLERETRNLATALRSPATRGRWGELQLRKVVEMAGMLEHCDFEVQVSTDASGARLRPDLVVHLPGGKHVIVDAKVPLDAYQSAIVAETEEDRRALLQRHARQVRSHVDALAKKEYWRQIEPSPEFVVAFVPGDPLLAAAFEHDPGLIEHAMANHVLPATPTTLISLLWAVAYSWQQDTLADNAREVQRLGADLYQRLATLGDHLSKLGRSLSASVEAYNSAVGSLESRVLVTARRFPDLGVGGASEPLVQMEPIVPSVRTLHASELVEGRGEGGEDPAPVGLPIDGAEPAVGVRAGDQAGAPPG